MKKLIVIIIFIMASIIGYNYVYQDHRNIEEEQPTFTTTARMLSNEFSIDPATSEKKYLNKTIEVSGTITGKSDNTITLDNTVFCQLSQTIDKTIASNAPIKIKGRVIGYDDLLEEIKLDQCTILIN